MPIKISLTQFLTFEARVSPSAKWNYIVKQKSSDEYSPFRDYWRDFRKAVKQLPFNGGDLSVLNEAIDKVKPDKKPNYVRTINNFKSFVKNNNIEFFAIGKAQWTMKDELLVNASPDIGMIINGKRYFVKLFPNVPQKNTKLNFRSVQNILTLLQETDTDFDKSTGNFAVLRINSPHFFIADSIDRKASHLLVLNAKNFVNFWNEV